MGEIGHITLLHDMRLWHIRAAIRGQARKNRTAWEVGRMTTFTMAKLAGNEELRRFSDIIPFPWDNENDEPTKVTEEDIQFLQDMINKENERVLG